MHGIDARRRRRGDPEEPAGEAADELPELSPVTDQPPACRRSGQATHMIEQRAEDPHPPPRRTGVPRLRQRVRIDRRGRADRRRPGSGRAQPPEVPRALGRDRARGGGRAAAARTCRSCPYSAIPDDQIGHIAPGRPTFYATSIPRAGGALPVLVESHDGRPTKIEGNPQAPREPAARPTPSRRPRSSISTAPTA